MKKIVRPFGFKFIVRNRTLTLRQVLTFRSQFFCRLQAFAKVYTCKIAIAVPLANAYYPQNLTFIGIIELSIKNHRKCRQN